METFMTPTQKALLTKELSKASAALQGAFKLASFTGTLDLAKSLREQQRAVAAQITMLNGGPVKLTAAELLRS
jgi:hypothetical protein